VRGEGLRGAGCQPGFFSSWPGAATAGPLRRRPPVEQPGRRAGSVVGRLVRRQIAIALVAAQIVVTAVTGDSSIAQRART